MEASAQCSSGPAMGLELTPEGLCCRHPGPRCLLGLRPLGRPRGCREKRGGSAAREQERKWPGEQEGGSAGLSQAGGELGPPQ